MSMNPHWQSAAPQGTVGRAPVALDEAGRFAEDLPCLGCGYNLRGLAPDGDCPECGMLAEDSARGDLLMFADPHWVRRLARGVALLLWAVLITIVAMFMLSLVASLYGLDELLVLGMFAIGVLWLVGYWWITTPPPEESPTLGAWNARAVARFCLVGAFVLTLIETGVARTLNMPWLEDTIFLSDLTGLVGMLALLLYASRLAMRLPRVDLAMQARGLFWGWLVLSLAAVIFVVGIMFTAFGPSGMQPMNSASQATPVMAAIFIGGCALGLGWLVVAIWTLVLMFLFYFALSRAAAQAAAHRAPILG